MRLPRTRTLFVRCVATFVLPSVPSERVCKTSKAAPARCVYCPTFVAEEPERTVRVTSQQSTFRVRRGPRAHPRPPCCPRPLRRHSVSPSRSARRLRAGCTWPACTRAHWNRSRRRIGRTTACGVPFAVMLSRCTAHLDKPASGSFGKNVEGLVSGSRYQIRS